ncbi:MAG: TetR/AcrR family transcriptional regulator [Rhodospirillaceae bacterium]|nr:TetR/AcrR family transcriptional regulator [Rhodospirillaceae bacterium]MBL6930049.1 TetR/AcrR family transcriptional regulator [Rhodospirillales bacterium]MBL6941968.1 TetR/AcrR family transcriptional regulator [Rhodospirillales bacterium]
MAEFQRRKGSETRDLILSFAESAVLEKGFGGTSIDELIAAVGITKSGFFYHFKDKNELAKALLQQYLDREEELFDRLFERADDLNDDPLHGFLVFLKLLAEILSDLPKTHPGCLVSAFCYQDQLFSSEIRELNAAGVLRWRQRFLERLELIARHYPPKIKVDMSDLADMVTGIIEGGIVISRSVRDKDVLPQQVLLFRRFVRSVFLGN